VRYLIRIEASMSIDLELYRDGNSNNPCFYNVSHKNIVKYKDPVSGLTMARGMSGGISTFTCPKPEKIGIGLSLVKLFQLNSLSLVIGLTQKLKYASYYLACSRYAVKRLY
jgi:hypothetical protein